MPWGFQEGEAPRFLDSRHMKVVRLSALGTGRLHPLGNIAGTHLCSGWVDPTAIVRLGGLCQWKIPIRPLRIEPATFRLVAQCLHQLHHRVAPYYCRKDQNFSSFPNTKYCFINSCHCYLFFLLLVAETVQSVQQIGYGLDGSEFES
jgi:hypothetical protein